MVIINPNSRICLPVWYWLGFPWWLRGKKSACNAGDVGDTGSIPGSGRSPGGGHGNPLQCFCWENPMDRGERLDTACGVKSRTGLKRLSTHVHDTDYSLYTGLLQQRDFSNSGNKSVSSARHIGRAKDVLWNKRVREEWENEQQSLTHGPVLHFAGLYFDCQWPGVRMYYGNEEPESCLITVKSFKKSYPGLSESVTFSGYM